MNSEITISVRDVGFWYPKKRTPLWWRAQRSWALRNISFDVHSGETIGVIGRNGTGKTTLLKLLAGIMAPDHGSVVNYGARSTLVALQVGFVDALSGRQNAILSAMLQGASRQWIVDRLDEIHAFSELGEKFGQPLYTYSSGMKARLGFSIAINVESDVILLDEVLSVGDISFQDKSARAIQELITSDKTVVLVSHNMGTIKELCNRVLWIENGEMRAHGDSEEIVDMYTKQRTAG
jgi:lipopolysaccharide transport system ATP-binding protein